MKKAKTNPQNENLVNVLKQLTKRIEEVTADIHDIRGDMAGIHLGVDVLKIDGKVIKSDLEKLRDELKETEYRLNKRITHVGDLITIQLGKKIKNIRKRVVNHEHHKLKN